MITIDPKISDYIDLAIERQRVIFDANLDVRLREQDVKMDLRFREQDERIDNRLKVQDSNIDTKLNIFNVDSERHMGMLLEEFQDRLQIVKEWIKDLPTREEVRTMIQDETNPIRRDLALFKIEMSNLRKVSNNHDVRIVRLEQNTA